MSTEDCALRICQACATRMHPPPWHFQGLDILFLGFRVIGPPHSDAVDSLTNCLLALRRIPGDNGGGRQSPEEPWR